MTNYSDDTRRRDHEQGNWKRKCDYSRMYMKPRSHENIANNSGKMFMKGMMAKFFKGVKSTDVGVIEMRN